MNPVVNGVVVFSVPFVFPAVIVGVNKVGPQKVSEGLKLLIHVV